MDSNKFGQRFYDDSDSNVNIVSWIVISSLLLHRPEFDLVYARNFLHTMHLHFCTTLILQKNVTEPSMKQILKLSFSEWKGYYQPQPEEMGLASKSSCNTSSHHMDMLTPVVRFKPKTEGWNKRWKEERGQGITRPVWTGFKIAVRHKLLTHNYTRLYTAYKKGNSKYYSFIMK